MQQKASYGAIFADSHMNVHFSRLTISFVDTDVHGVKGHVFLKSAALSPKTILYYI